MLLVCFDTVCNAQLLKTILGPFRIEKEQPCGISEVDRGDKPTATVYYRRSCLRSAMYCSGQAQEVLKGDTSCHTIPGEYILYVWKIPSKCGFSNNFAQATENLATLKSGFRDTCPHQKLYLQAGCPLHGHLQSSLANMAFVLQPAAATQHCCRLDSILMQFELHSVSLPLATDTIQPASKTPVAMTCLSAVHCNVSSTVAITNGTSYETENNLRTVALKSPGALFGIMFRSLLTVCAPLHTVLCHCNEFVVLTRARGAH